jgi:hypothetical protein
MPIRTGISHALLGVTVATTWVLFKNALEIFITRNQITSGFLYVADVLSTLLGLSISHGKLVTMLLIGFVTVIAFTWGYVFHHARFNT